MPIFLLLAILLLVSCGPRDIGSGSSEEEKITTSVSAAEQMRYPMYGADANQHMLFQANTMDTMVLKQNIMYQGLRPPKEGTATINPALPAYREHPKQPSPFRE